MEVYLIRHAHAGSRLLGSHDRYRPLSENGHAEAEAIAQFFASRPPSSVLSSPATRCVQTVAPLAEACGLTVGEHEHLWEDATLSEFEALVLAVSAGLADDQDAVVVCTHGNLIPSMVERLAVDGVPVRGRGCERASMWALTMTTQGWSEANYLSPRNNYGQT